MHDPSSLARTVFMIELGVDHLEAILSSSLRAQIRARLGLCRLSRSPLSTWPTSLIEDVRETCLSIWLEKARVVDSITAYTYDFGELVEFPIQICGLRGAYFYMALESDPTGPFITVQEAISSAQEEYAEFIALGEAPE